MTTTTTEVFTQEEFTCWRYEILSKTNGANIHVVTNKLGAIQGFIDLILRRPEKADYYNQIIDQTKLEICKAVYKF